MVASGLEPGALDGMSLQWVLRAVGAAAPVGQVVGLAAGSLDGAGAAVGSAASISAGPWTGTGTGAAVCRSASATGAGYWAAAAVIVAEAVAVHAGVVDATYVEGEVVFALASGRAYIVAVVVAVDNVGCEERRVSLRQTGIVLSCS